METERENSIIRQFLLGGPETDDTAALGARLIDEPALEDRFRFAEETLIEDFLDDALTAAERELFLANFMTTPARLARLEELALLKRLARRERRAAEDAPPEKKSAAGRTGWRALIGGYWRPLAAAALVLVAALAVWRLAFYPAAGGPTALEREYAARNAENLADASRTNGLTVKNLAPGAFRQADAGAARLTAAELTESVLFRLVLPPATPADATFDVELQKEGAPVFRLAKLRVYENPNGRELRVLLPKSRLERGNYRLRLSDGGIYAFLVE